MRTTLKKTIFYLMTAFTAFCTPSFAGGPLVTVKINGKAVVVVYPASDFPIPFSTDRGTLGIFTNDEATALVNDCFEIWQDVSTATITFQNAGQLSVDVNANNYSSYLNNLNDGINPIVFDSDGSITDAFFGQGLSDQVIGFAGSGYSTGTGYYVEGQALLNGKFSTDFTYEQFKATFVHEFGHFFGLDHTQINLEYASDGDTGNDENIPTMFPTSTDDDTSLGELNPDDEAAVTLLYPAGNYFATYGRITGNVVWASGGPVLGANVVAVKEGDEAMSQFSSVSDYYRQNDGSYEMLVTPGTYRLFIEPVNEQFTGGSAVGPYAESTNGQSFTSPVTRQNYSGTVTVSAGQTVSDIDFTAGEGAQTTTTVSGSQCPSGFPVDCENGYCCTSEYPVCGESENVGQCFQEGTATTTISSTTTSITAPVSSTTSVPAVTTTTVSDRLCPASAVLGDDSYETDLLRNFRDKILLSSETGRELVRLYYQHSPELTAMLMRDPDLRAAFREVLAAILPHVQALMDGTRATVSRDTLTVIRDLCEKISQNAGPSLQEDIEILKNRFNETTSFSGL